jgi:AraC family transcriptional regulator, transcriptional activator of pobA
MNTEIKNFGLYGREASTVAAEFIHLVSIDSSCRKHNWVIKPHFHSKLYQFFFIESGQGKFVFNEKTRHFSDKTLIIMPENNLHGFEFSEDTIGFTLSVSSHIVNKIIGLDKELAYEINRVRLINLNNNTLEFDSLMTTINSMQRELAQKEEKIELALEVLIGLLMIKIYRLRDKVGKEYIESSRELNYYMAFMKAVKNGVPTNKSIDDFTKTLGISKTHLNRVCQTIVGEPTKQVIANYLINEAMILLAHTDMTISEIAHQLDFKDVSYFCRFFKKQTNASPARFRYDNLNIEHVENMVTLNY